MRKITALAAFSFAIILSACATPISYDRTSAGNVRTIGLVTWEFPDGVQVVQGAAPFLDPVGGIMQSHRNDILNLMLERHDFDIRDAFLERVTANLERDGYTVTLIEAERPGGYLLNSYPSEPPVDAYLNIYVSNYGYFAAYDGDIARFLGFGGYLPYRPAFVLDARLIRASDYAVLMQNHIVYNPEYPSDRSGVIITPTPEFEFVDFDALEADPTKAVLGMRDATFKTADALSNLMK